MSRAGGDGRLRIASPSIALVLGALACATAAAAEVLTFAAHRFSPGSDAGQIATIGSFAVVGVIVARHVPRNPLGWILLGGATFLALSDAASLYVVLDYLEHGGTLPLGAVAMLLQESWAPAILLIGLAIMLFPDGRLPAAWLRWPLGAMLALGALWWGGALAITMHAIVSHQVRVTASGDLAELDHPTGFAAAAWGREQYAFFFTLATSWLAWLASQTRAYRRSSGVRRIQLKWLLTGASICVVCGIASVVLQTAFSSRLASAVGSVLVAGIVALPLSIGVGILRYRLYEIDRLVSRTLSYAILTGSLVALYLGLVTLITRTLPLSSPFAVAASTLAAAALFNPLRTRIQHAVDRRFNRARYDAEATIANFTASLRDAVDLDTVEGLLVEVVRGSVEPAHASVWIRTGVPRERSA